jgi:hypothetical protein
MTATTHQPLTAALVKCIAEKQDAAAVSDRQFVAEMWGGTISHVQWHRIKNGSRPLSRAALHYIINHFPDLADAAHRVLADEAPPKR